MENKIKEMEQGKSEVKALQKRKEELILRAAELLIEAFSDSEESGAVKSITIYYDHEMRKNRDITVENLKKSYKFITNTKNPNYNEKF